MAHYIYKVFYKLSLRQDNNIASILQMTHKWLSETLNDWLQVSQLVREPREM